MSKIIDCRGLACPEPVIRIQKELKNVTEKNAAVLVSSSAARDNVARIAGKMGWKVSIENNEDGFKLNCVK